MKVIRDYIKHTEVIYKQIQTMSIADRKFIYELSKHAKLVEIPSEIYDRYLEALYNKVTSDADFGMFLLDNFDPNRLGLGDDTYHFTITNDINMSILVNKHIISIYGYGTKESYKRGTGGIIYSDGEWDISVKELMLSVVFSLMVSIKILKELTNQVINRSTHPQHFSKCNIWNRRRIVPNPIEYWLIQDELKLIEHSILKDFKYYRSIISDYVTLPDDMQLYEIFEPIDVSKRKLIVDDFQFSDLRLPSPNMFISLKTKLEYHDYIRKEVAEITAIAITDASITLFVTFPLTPLINTLTIYKDNCLVPKTIRELTLSYVECILHYINSFHTLILENASETISKPIKEEGLHKVFTMSKEYREILLKNRTVHRHEQSSIITQRKECPYAYMIKGHQVHRIHKGTLPIDPELRTKLEANPRRRLYLTNNQISDKDKVILSERGIIIQDNEWVSVLESYRQSHICNSKEGKNPLIKTIYTDK